MGRISIPMGGLLVLGVLLVILAGFSNGSIPPSSDWERNFPYFLLIGGATLITIAIVFILKNRK